MDKLYKEYLAWINKVVDLLYDQMVAEDQENYIREGGCTDNYEMLEEMTYQNFLDNLMPLFQIAVNRGCRREDLEKIFPDEITGLV